MPRRHSHLTGGPSISRRAALWKRAPRSVAITTCGRLTPRRKAGASHGISRLRSIRNGNDISPSVTAAGVLYFVTDVQVPAPFNTPARDYSPHLSPDGKYVFFSSERGFSAATVTSRFTSYRDLITRLRSTVNGSGTIYQIDAAVLDSLGK